MTQAVAGAISQGKRTPRLGTVHSRELGEELRRLRHRVQLSSGAVSEALGWSPGKLSRLEAGRGGAALWEIGALLGHYGVDRATCGRLVAMAGEPDSGSFLRRHDQSGDALVALTLHEQVALSITVYEPLLVPSLAQTEEYAHALTGSAAVVQGASGASEGGCVNATVLSSLCTCMRLRCIPWWVVGRSCGTRC